MSTATGGADPEGITLLSLSYGYTYFGSHQAGTDSIDPVRTDRIDAHLFALSLRHHFGGGVAAGLQVPIGSIRVVPLGGEPTFVSGFGDLEVDASYELGRWWGTGGFAPSIRVRPFLTLPTGESAEVLDPAVPPNLISVGSGAIGVGGEVQLTKYVARQWAVKAWLGGRQPLTYNERGLRFGGEFRAGAGAIFRPQPKLLIGLDLGMSQRASSRERDEGEIVNSGGTWLTPELSVSYVFDSKYVAGLSARAPVWADVNGEQITQTFGVGAFVAISFGGGDDEEKHEHGEEKHEHGEEKHEHGEEKHEHGEEKHEHGEEKHEHGGVGDGDGDGDGNGAGGDVRDLVTGGESFALADAVVPGKIVVVDFWADWCHPCKDVTALLKRRAGADPGLAVRKVEVPTFDHPVAKEHLADAEGLPVVWFLDREGKVVRKLVKTTADQVEQALDELTAP